MKKNSFLSGLIFAAVSFLLVSPAAAQGFGLNHEVEYAACMALTVEKPEQAFESALTWRNKGGGNPAEHCVALALIGMGNYDEGAKRLEELAQSLEPAYRHLRADTLAQAGQAWLLVGDFERAQAVQSAALELDPNNVELLLDRSLTLGAAAHYWEAIDDLNLANEYAPERADILILRASAYRLVEAYELAFEDVSRALALSPDNGEALLERGNLHRLLGDDAAARADWHRVTLLDGESPTADAARSNLEKLEIQDQQ